MSLARAVTLIVQGICGGVSADHLDEDELQELSLALVEAERAVRSEMLDRIIARTSRLPVSYPLPETADEPRAVAPPFALEPQA